jgi:hypothetical protein
MVVADRDGVVVEHAAQPAVAHKQVVPVKVAVQDHALSGRAQLDVVGPFAPLVQELQVGGVDEALEAGADRVRVGLWRWGRRLNALAPHCLKHARS